MSKAKTLFSVDCAGTVNFLKRQENPFQERMITYGEISGIILNPWNRTIMLDKKLISIILGNENS